jgi:hypothetical protein
MKTTPIPAAATHFRKLAIHFQYLMITLVVLSIGILCILAHGRDTHATTVGHLKSSWFHSPTDSRGATDSACLRSAGRLSAPGATRTAHA